MHDPTKAALNAAAVDIHLALNKIEDALKSTSAVLNNATRFAVFDECLALALQRWGNAKYDLAQTRAYGDHDNFTSADIEAMEVDIAHFRRLLKNAEFNLQHEKKDD